MTTIPDWMINYGDGLTVADYDALSEEVCRQIEIIDGAVVISPRPPRTHQHIAYQLATVLGDVAPPGSAAVGGVDLRLRDVPLLNRRPDVVVYDASLPDHEVLRPEHCCLVVEIMFPGSVTTDQIDKPAEYAVAGIRHFWRIEIEQDRAISAFRYQLDPTTGRYALADLDKDKLSIKDPIVLELDLGRLMD